MAIENTSKTTLNTENQFIDERDDRRNVIFLFDVDGTLTPSRKFISKSMADLLASLKKKVYLGFVGGSDISKQKEQLKDKIDLFDFSFPENGVLFYRNGKLIRESSLVQKFGEELYQKIINFSLRHLSEIKLPKKRGNFIECRKGVLNICPIGRDCTDEERKEFYEFDKKEGIRLEMVKELEKEFGEYNIHFSIGGQISIDCFPKGWDKTYCLQYLEGFKVYFFGDMVEKGGNDHEIFIDERVTGIRVYNPEDTEIKIKEVSQKEGFEL